jgi:hypothetical protein
VSTVNGSSPMTDFRFCLRLSMEPVLDSWIRIERRAVTFSSGLGFDRLNSEVLGLVVFFSASDSEVLDVKDSFDAELRSFEVCILRFPSTPASCLASSLVKSEKPTADVFEDELFRPPNNGRTFLMGSRGE